MIVEIEFGGNCITPCFPAARVFKFLSSDAFKPAQDKTNTEGAARRAQFSHTFR